MTRVPAAVFFGLFTISGFAGLIYESIWSHYLKLFLGHAAYAQTLVLAIFMGGMALGSWLVSRFTERIGSHLRGYALAEGGIGLLAIVFHRVFVATTDWTLGSLLPAMGPGIWVDVVKWLIASALILPASVLLGTTFPLMSAGVIRLYPDAGGRALSMLYFTNSLGAAVGVMASGFVLIARFGLPGTMLTAGLVNIALALVVWLIARREAPAARAPQGDASSGTLGKTLLLAAAATGAASFIYEVTWIRMLSTGLGSSTHSFEVMLAAFILGMALGALALRAWIDRIRNDLAWLTAILVAKATFAVYAVWVYGHVLEFVRWMLAATARSDPGYDLVNVAGLAASMAVMLPTAFCAGMTLPLATSALARRGHGEASIGRVYAANTAGCIVGTAFATHIGMEALGVKGLTGMGALVDIAVALAIVAVGLEGRVRARALAAGAVFCALGGAAFASLQLDLLRMGSGVFRFGLFDNPRTTSVAFYRDGKTASISVIDHNDIGRRSIRTNGKADASLTLGEGGVPTPDEVTCTLVAALPLAMKPGAATVANIGFGSGLTTHVLLGSPNVRSVDSIEIERAMVDGARLFMPRNRRAFEDPRSHIVIDDAKTYFASRDKRYDIIVSEPSNPWVSGVSTLFSHEFYARARRHLAPDGLFVQWVQAYDIGPDLLATIFGALGSQFGDYVVYRVDSIDLLIVATPGRALPPIGPDVFGFPALAADLSYIGYRSPQDLEALRLGSRAVLERAFGSFGLPANSDYFPVLDQNASRARFRGDSAEDLRTSREKPVPVMAMLDSEVRVPLDRVRSPGEVQPAHVARARVAAEAMGVFLTGRADAASRLRPAELSAATIANALLDGCADARHQWTNAVHEVLALATPILGREEVSLAFRRIRASRCWQALDTVARVRIELLEAINNRDAAGMLRHGEWLLAQPGRELDAARAMWLMAALTGALAGGDRERARTIWNAHVPNLSAAARDAFLFRVLVGRLRAGS
jgi:predicted membrane-bound spermidine synthase